MEQDEYCYVCLADIPVVVDGIEVGKKKCRKKFSTEIQTDSCPECGNSELRFIPKAFLVLWDTEDKVKEYVTETMDVRTGLDSEDNAIARAILDKYSGVEQEIKEPAMDFSI